MNNVCQLDNAGKMLLEDFNYLSTNWQIISINENSFYPGQQMFKSMHNKFLSCSFHQLIKEVEIVLPSQN